MSLASRDFIFHQAFADQRGMHDVCASGGGTHKWHHLPSSTHTAKTGKLFIPGSRKKTTSSIHGRELGPERHMGLSKSKSYKNFSHTTDQENYMIISSGSHKVNNSTAMVMPPPTTCHLLIQHTHQGPISKELNDCLGASPWLCLTDDMPTPTAVICPSFCSPIWTSCPARHLSGHSPNFLHHTWTWLCSSVPSCDSTEAAATAGLLQRPPVGWLSHKDRLGHFTGFFGFSGLCNHAVCNLTYMQIVGR